MLEFLNYQLLAVDKRLAGCQTPNDIEDMKRRENSIFELYKDQDVAGKRYIIDLLHRFQSIPSRKN